MMILANALSVGDAIRINDWNLHVVAVEPGPRTAVRTAEFDFFLHFHAQDGVNIDRAVHPDARALRVQRTA